ncbi:Aspartyl/asparaginyl beta-hydroxylase, cupin superfamily [Sphingomonas laterariae]|uniref:Aspartyl/asparaginyl beta-hydroxylase, cupin superfamily n=1 Tax=Edaphosphingomonas laterariae TaxID=861865 RepID=A0A239IFC0_9SPHN|nr:aspartyl/asparaginyl beta-hydroxylase domain-containing protein [Sphingomonas laterariae]SNS92350.1 Aspartyl/asparaginyl beta-hydroxylase, cupin superfamily [Sphingomonas laterariae]
MKHQGEEVTRLLAAATAARQRGDQVEEVRLIDAVLVEAPDNPHALNARGMVCLATRDLAGAIGFFRRAAEADPREPALWMNLARAQRETGDDEGERASIDQVLAVDQRHFMARLRKAELHERLGEHAQAVPAWQAVLSLATAIDPMPPALGEALDRARAFVIKQTDAFASEIDGGMATAKAALPEGATRRFDACLDHVFGRRQIYRNECAGVHFPFLPAHEYFDRALFPWFAELEAKTDLIRTELEGVIARSRGMRPYVAMDPGTPQNKWSGLDGSLDWGAYFLWEYGVANEEACALCPNTVAALEATPFARIPGRAPTAFFSILKPRTRIPPHTGVTNTRTIIHLPLIVPDGCGLRVGGETRQWRLGEAMAFDDTIEHEAWNDSDELRAVLIFDVWNPFLTEAERDLLCRYFELADKSGHNPAMGQGL